MKNYDSLTNSRLAKHRLGFGGRGKQERITHVHSMKERSCEVCK